MKSKTSGTDNILTALTRLWPIHARAVFLISAGAQFVRTSCYAPRHLNDAKYWRDRAIELRMVADGYLDKTTAATFLRLADGYEKMADRAEDRAKHQVHQPMPTVVPNATEH